MSMREYLNSTQAIPRSPWASSEQKQEAEAHLAARNGLGSLTLASEAHVVSGPEIEVSARFTAAHATMAGALVTNTAFNGLRLFTDERALEDGQWEGRIFFGGEGFDQTVVDTLHSTLITMANINAAQMQEQHL
jgi:hypothetical protein